MFAQKSLLITGGTGSFGEAVLKRFLQGDIGEIKVFSRDEKKQDDMRNYFSDDRLKFCIGDVRDFDSIADAVKGVDYVFHAAALKQVPSCEFHPMEAIKTNVLGTENTIKASINAGVKRFVLLSTDKAVHPVNAMGMTKALAEKVLIANTRHLGDEDGTFCFTRYGNVMASRGSVIPLFISQIKHKKEITVTDPDMTRFIMSLEDSIELVLYAFLNGAQGDTFVQKAPACSIAVLVEALRQLFDKKGVVKIIGTRHGEKLYETLVSVEEMHRAIDRFLAWHFPDPDRR